MLTVETVETVVVTLTADIQVNDDFLWISGRALFPMSILATSSVRERISRTVSHPSATSGRTSGKSNKVASALAGQALTSNKSFFQSSNILQCDTHVQYTCPRLVAAHQSKQTHPKPLSTS